MASEPPDPPEVPRLRYMPALDGLRAVAVLGVLAFHGGYLDGGFLGVDLFFVLSGFLITGLLVKEHEAIGRIRLARFWLRRARRLLPALLLTLVGVAGYAAWLAAPTELVRIRADGFAALLYVANWHAVYADQDYWALFSAPSPLAHTWSLAIEEQFYLVWPLVVALALRAKGSVRRLGAVSVVVALVALALMAVLYGVDTARVYFGTDTRASGLAIGAALAAAVHVKGHPAARRVLSAIALVACVVLGAAWWALSGQQPLLYRGGFAVCQLAVAALLLNVSHPDADAMTRVLSWGPLRWVGTISYGLYLWHWPVFVWLRSARIGIDGAALFALRLAVSFGVATASFYLLERPLRREGFGGRRMALIAPAALAAVAGVVFFGTLPRLAQARAPGPRPWMPADGLAAHRSAPIDLMLVGDSVAQSLGRGAQPILSELGVKLTLEAGPGCAMFEAERRLRLPDGTITRPAAKCAPPIARMKRAVATHRPAQVLLVLASPPRGAWSIAGGWHGPCDAPYDELFGRRAHAAVAALGADGARVFVASSPYMMGDGGDASGKRLTDCANERLKAAVDAHPFATWIDFNAWVCPARRCRTHHRGFLLRHDGLHFAGDGAEVATWWLFDEVRAGLAKGR